MCWVMARMVCTYLPRLSHIFYAKRRGEHAHVIGVVVPVGDEAKANWQIQRDGNQKAAANEELVSAQDVTKKRWRMSGVHLSDVRRDTQRVLTTAELSSLRLRSMSATSSLYSEVTAKRYTTDAGKKPRTKSRCSPGVRAVS